MSKANLRQCNDCSKRVLKSARLTYVDKTRGVYYLPETLPWWEMVLFIKGKYAILSLFTTPKVLFSAYYEVKL